VGSSGADSWSATRLLLPVGGQREGGVSGRARLPAHGDGGGWQPMAGSAAGSSARRVHGGRSSLLVAAVGPYRKHAPLFIKDGTFGQRGQEFARREPASGPLLEDVGWQARTSWSTRPRFWSLVTVTMMTTLRGSRRPGCPYRAPRRPPRVCGSSLEQRRKSQSSDSARRRRRRTRAGCAHLPPSGCMAYV